MFQSITSSPHFYDWLLLAVAALAAFNVFEVVFLLLHKRRQDRAEDRKEALKRRITETLLSEDDPPPALPEPRDNTDFEAYSEAACSIVDSFEGEIARKASELISRRGVDAYYRRLAREGVWYKRSHAVDILSSLKLKANREFFLAAFKAETSAAVKYRLIFGLSLLVRDREEVLALARLLSGLPYLTSKYTEDIFYNAITALKALGREDEFTAFLTVAMNDGAIGTLVKRDSVGACDAAACEHSDKVVEAYHDAFAAEPEIQIACLKSLARMGDFSRVQKALKAKDWRVQLTALKYAHLGGLENLNDISDLLHARNYHVRVNAALALAKHGGYGRRLLEAEVRGGDKYAAAAARYALESAEGRP